MPNWATHFEPASLRHLDGLRTVDVRVVAEHPGGEQRTPVLAKFERELIAGRTRAGLAAARARGRKGGRPQKMDRETLCLAMTKLADRKVRAAGLARRSGITTTTLYTDVNGDGTVKEPGHRLLEGPPE